MKDLISANELRLGNLYHDNGVFKKASPGTIEEVWNTPRSWCKPIPLTEEWLLKFGFKLAGDFTNTRVLNVVKHAYDCSEITYSPNEGLLRFSNGGIKGSTIIPYVKHVHQLQNLYFALTGEELTLNQES